MDTSIEWTRGDDGSRGKSWNPVVGCAHVSPGCDRCYAARDAAGRLRNIPVYAGLAERPDGQPARFTGEVRCLPERLDQPLRWRKPRRIFVNSMSDLFHPDVPDEFIHSVWAKMSVTPRHTYQILTKRPQRMASWMARAVERWGPGDLTVLPNVWLGTSIEADRYVWRADHLRRTHAAFRFLSLEPLLEPLPSLELDGIDWVIIGGESGSGARPMEITWAEAIVERCRDAGVAVFVKQIGLALGGKTHHDIETFPASLRIREHPAPRPAGSRQQPVSDVLDDGPACSVCGCTEDDPCPGGCHWVPSPDPGLGDLCSACVGVED
jgi:protein gp37